MNIPTSGAGNPWWAPMTAAVGFLTIIPMPSRPLPASVLARSAAFFPLVGAALGAMLGGIGWLLDGVLPRGPVAALLLALGVILTGALHLDGLMDTADGAFGGRTRERRLEIMRDSRVGSFGVLAGALALLLQFACLTELAGEDRLRAIVAALVASRWAMVIALSAFAPARADGLGAGMRAVAGRGSLIASSIATIVLLAAAGPPGPAAMIAAGIVALGGGILLARRLGGLTGDSYGAIAVVAETAALLAAVAVGVGGAS